MKKIKFLLVLMFFAGVTFGQNIILTFEGEMALTGEPVTMNSVIIENLTSGGSIELTEEFFINITGVTTGIPKINKILFIINY